MAPMEVQGPRKTRRWVLIADKMADRAITVGGVLVIAAVLGMMVFLVHEVLPLFAGGSVIARSDYILDSESNSVLAIILDEYKTVAASVRNDGTVTAWHARTGTYLDAPSFDFNGKEVRAFSRTIDNVDMAFGLNDGTVRFGRLTLPIEVIPAAQAPMGLKTLDEQDSSDGSTVFSTVPGGQIRKISVRVELEDPIKVSDSEAPVVALDYRVSNFGDRPKKILAAVNGQGQPSLTTVESKLNMFTRKVTTSANRTDLPTLPQEAAVAYALVNDLADTVLFAEKSGKVYRYNTRDVDHPVLVETVDLLPAGVELTVFGYLLGDHSVVVGGSDGSVSIYFLLQRNDAQTSDGFSLVKTREFEPQPGAITALSPSQRGKTFATADATGQVWIRHGTSQKTLLRLGSKDDKLPPRGIVLAPRLDGMLVVRNDWRGAFWDLNISHPETSLHTLFGKVWYEGYPEPTYTWQSTGATEGFEPKISLVPLIFGTLKATFYSLMFAIPIALLGAIYTSEFLPYTVRGKVKPVMETMASLPSVVLGFVAALVLAPIVETSVSAVILTFGLLPLALIFVAYLWQLLPQRLALRLQGLPKFFVIGLVVAAAVCLAYLGGPFFERVFFAGDFRAWLNGDVGKPAPSIFLLVIPGMALLVSWVSSRLFGRRFALYVRGLAMPYSALMDLLRWVGQLAAIVCVSYVVAQLIALTGFDPRGSLVGTYTQRNTLVVGFAMGFAVIPIIYTLAEDALNSVPEHLRSASLACGATPWQTALWIILPTAISGVFSAIMIGMGRAVGETMIVVMSAGNTPLIDLNIFDGLRALSANIAVELPEAPKDGTLYRVLFMTGLVLFGMTFVINTVAELVRLRFRKRAMQL
ncbi:MAG TPA: ABC transporter permease [Desulfomonilaceae bacterium]|nr:ABC transporter permease [Desulfomonilaceae bacterium]